MTLNTSNQQTYLNHLLKIILVVALVFAVWHVASHDVSSGHEECQVCRLNHVPIADLPVPAWIIPLFIASLLLVFLTLQRPIQSYRYTLGARAPPLF